jgi:hypothetical protein
MDIEGVDTPEGRLARAAEMAPVTPHTLDPVTGVHEVAHLAGFGPSPAGGGHDAFEGVAEMVYDVDGLGERDAMEELHFDDGTPGPVLQLAPDESIFSEDTPDQDHLGMDMVRFDLDVGIAPGPSDGAAGGDPHHGLPVDVEPGLESFGLYSDSWGAYL